MFSIGSFSPERKPFGLRKKGTIAAVVLGIYFVFVGDNLRYFLVDFLCE